MSIKKKVTADGSIGSKSKNESYEILQNRQKGNGTKDKKIKK